MPGFVKSYTHASSGMAVISVLATAATVFLLKSCNAAKAKKCHDLQPSRIVRLPKKRAGSAIS
jgi:hypothetical protein